jgi:hypothetical protein
MASLVALSLYQETGCLWSYPLPFAQSAVATLPTEPVASVKTFGSLVFSGV